MKVHYINILLFALPLNILEHNERNHKSTTLHTPKIPTTRLLCECDLYMTNYDNDLEMKKVMENFNKQTQQRFEEYDERIQSKRKHCKDKCDKEIQKIILKDKLEKQMEQELTTLETKINIHDIPTCVCEKSLADKTEKFCLNCGVNIGGGVTLSSGVLGGIGAVALSPWQTKAMAAATAAAEKAGALSGKAVRIPEGIKAVFLGIKSNFPIEKLGFGSFKSLINERTYTNVEFISDTINTQYRWYCRALDNVHDDYVYTFFQKLGHAPGNVLGSSSGEVSIPDAIKAKVTEVLAEATKVAETEAARVAAAKKGVVLETSKKAIGATSYNWYTTISYSITAILIIVLIMVIIYLILRYRRKKKMKKKLQYIKLLEE
ncbi:rifin PIR protein, putative [Plasmodium reichenowi]|uniref:Rifin PIR protein, putative n=1 Tax=Plasmodium reichenowi TaxID=5854 RepID=A0A2P9DT64_PLARE|nr:rifin PIR protein, putative [Plasmodium reichenowi]SOV84191.1 rifin PIR protein, putative [Plasmodium reichenowi]